MYYTHHYVIDWNKVKTLEDMKLLIAAIEIAFEPNNQNLDSIKHLVHKEEKSGNLYFNTSDVNIPIETS